jgi:hypothetical protein
MVAVEVARHTRMKNANVAGYDRFDVNNWNPHPQRSKYGCYKVVVALSAHSAD